MIDMQRKYDGEGGRAFEEAEDEKSQSLVLQDANVDIDEQLKSISAEDDSELTYSQEYYILNRKDILAKRKEKELEAKFGDYSARLVKRPKKNFLWGYGTQMHEDR